MVITALTRNQVYRQRYRGFESHPLRQIFVESVQSEVFWLNTFTIFRNFFEPFPTAACVRNSCFLQITAPKPLVPQGFPGFWRESRREKTTPFPSEIQAPKAWHLPRTALCCSPDGRRCLPSWRNRCAPASPESVSSEHRLPA